MKKLILSAVTIILIIAGCSSDDNPANNTSTIEWSISNSSLFSSINIDAEFNVNGNSLSGSGVVIYEGSFTDTVNTSFSGMKSPDEIELDGKNPAGEDYFSYRAEKTQDDFGGTVYSGTVAIISFNDTLHFGGIIFPY